ncbi:MAG: hypothetical protein GX590_09155 [Lentisphaerae bacterium]|nr:hypothetical protein [Lentisphaerota bacterium]
MPIAVLTLAPGLLQGQAAWRQTLELQAGWNAVYIEVDPADPAPERAFAGLPVDAVATHDAVPSAAQFVQNPGADLSLAQGWAVWYAPSRPDAFLSNLYEVQGAKAYLVHATTNATLALAGGVPTALPAWKPDAFNFVGYPLQDPGAPTFAQFFAGSPAHIPGRIYRLAGGKWRQVTNPGAESMRAGEAFWIFCKGPSDYTGPLHVSTPSPFGVILSQRGGGGIVFRNRAPHPVALRLAHTADPDAPVPLSVTIEARDEATGELRKMAIHLPAGNWEQTLPTLEAGQAIRLPLELRAQDIPPGERHSLITVFTDLGTKTVVPVTATRDENP